MAPKKVKQNRTPIALEKASHAATRRRMERLLDEQKALVRLLRAEAKGYLDRIEDAAEFMNEQAAEVFACDEYGGEYAAIGAELQRGAARLRAGETASEPEDDEDEDEDDTGCPVSDPECEGTPGGCHDACEAPTPAATRARAVKL